MHTTGPVGPKWGHGTSVPVHPVPTGVGIIRSGPLFWDSGGISKEMKRSKFTAIAAASALALSVAGLAFATDLLDGQVGKALSTFDQDCSDFDGMEIGAGEIGVHFVLT